MVWNDDENAPQPGAFLCMVEDVPESQGREFVFGVDGSPFCMFMIRKGETIRGYVNSCPHIGTPLDIKAGEFLNQNRSHILCTTHGALFRIEDGYCISGPCVGSNLMALHAVMEKGEVFVSLPEPQRLA